MDPTPPGIDSWIDTVCATRGHYRLPVRADELARDFVGDALALLFPHFASHRRCDRPSVRAEVLRLSRSLDQFLAGAGHEVAGSASSFIDELPAIHDALVMDAQATLDADPAARSLDEVILAYPGFYALACHRFAHALWTRQVPLLPRLISETAHRVTGIVIGETSVIGDRVRLYQGVTLGALSVRKTLARTRRHPTIEHDVVIYANATILGGETVVGHSSVIGGNVWLTHSVPPNSIVTNASASERHAAEPGLSLDTPL